MQLGDVPDKYADTSELERVLLGIWGFYKITYDI